MGVSVSSSVADTLDLGPDQYEDEVVRAFDPFHVNNPVGPDLRALARRAGIDSNGWTYDTAVPHEWSVQVYDVTGYWPAQLGIVWAYSPSSIWGEPFALTREGAVLLNWYKRER